MERNRIITSISLIGLAALILILNITSPTEIGPVGVLVFFTTAYLCIFGIFTLILRAFSFFAFHKTKLRSKDYLYSAIMSFGPIMLLMARSFGVVTPWTISLIVIFLFLAEFLVKKRA